MKSIKSLAAQRAGRVAVVGAVGSSLVIAGIAYAAWTASGSGTGNANARSAQPLTVEAVGPTTIPYTLYPGGPAGAAYGYVSNTNPYPVSVTTVTLSDPVSSSPERCPSSNFTVVSGPITLASPVTIDTNSGQRVTVPDAISMISAAGDGCQNVAVNVTFTVAGIQATPTPTPTGPTT